MRVLVPHVKTDDNPLMAAAPTMYAISPEADHGALTPQEMTLFLCDTPRPSALFNA